MCPGDGPTGQWDPGLGRGGLADEFGGGVRGLRDPVKRCGFCLGARGLLKGRAWPSAQRVETDLTHLTVFSWRRHLRPKGLNQLAACPWEHLSGVLGHSSVLSLESPLDKEMLIF